MGEATSGVNRREGERERERERDTSDNLFLWLQSLVGLKVEIPNSSGECQVSIHSVELHPTSCLVDTILFRYTKLYTIQYRTTTCIGE